MLRQFLGMFRSHAGFSLETVVQSGGEAALMPWGQRRPCLQPAMVRRRLSISPLADLSHGYGTLRVGECQRWESALPQQ
jgi:hypothetical protein